MQVIFEKHSCLFPRHLLPEKAPTWA